MPVEVVSVHPVVVEPHYAPAARSVIIPVAAHPAATASTEAPSSPAVGPNWHYDTLACGLTMITLTLALGLTAIIRWPTR